MMNLRMTSPRFVGLLTTFSICVAAELGFAGTILSVPAPVASGPGMGFVAVPGIVTINPNNDNSAGGLTDNNIVVPLKRFDAADYIDIVFAVLPTAPPIGGGPAVTEYRVSEFVDNNSGINWQAYRMQLGFGTGAGFTLSGAGDGLDFDAPTFDFPPMSTAMPTVGLGADELVFSDGVHGSGAQLYEFRIDVPNLPSAGGPSTFTLRQIPVAVPEPGLWALAGMMLLGFLRRART
jgi:hypothetical protein